jgi:hypothetical protein
MHLWASSTPWNESCTTVDTCSCSWTIFLCVPHINMHMVRWGRWGAVPAHLMLPFNLLNPMPQLAKRLNQLHPIWRCLKMVTKSSKSDCSTWNVWWLGGPPLNTPQKMLLQQLFLTLPPSRRRTVLTVNRETHWNPRHEPNTSICFIPSVGRVSGWF